MFAIYIAENILKWVPKKTHNFKNLIKPQETLAKISGTTDNLKASKNADIIIGLTSGKPVITTKMISNVKESAIFMDAGKGCFSPSAIKAAKLRNLTIYL